MLGRIAAAMTDGKKSAAVEMLIDLYGGKILERAAQQREMESESERVMNYEVTRWAAPKLAPELIAYLAGLIRAGNLPEVGFQLAGVPPRMRSKWLKQGRNDRAAGKQSLYADLVAALERAEAECEAEDIRRLRKHGEQTWTALAWRLERQHPDRYGMRKRIDSNVRHQVFPVVDWDRLTQAEVRTLVELLRKASPEGDEPGLSRANRPALEMIPAEVADEYEVIEGRASTSALTPAAGELSAGDEKPEP